MINSTVLFFDSAELPCLFLRWRASAGGLRREPSVFVFIFSNQIYTFHMLSVQNTLSQKMYYFIINHHEMCNHAFRTSYKKNSKWSEVETRQCVASRTSICSTTAKSFKTTCSILKRRVCCAVQLSSDPKESQKAERQ